MKSKVVKTVKPFKLGDHVQWNWMGLKVQGTVQKVFFKPVQKTFRGSLYRRNGSADRPAYLVKSKAKNLVLKSHTELVSVKS